MSDHKLILLKKSNKFLYYVFTSLLYRKNKFLVLYEGFRTPSVHRGRSLPSCTATWVLLSESGPEWKTRDLFFF